MKQTFENDRVRVTFDEDVCTSADNCLKGLPQVFNGDRDPWINVDGADPAEIARVVATCPSGALTCQLLG